MQILLVEDARSVVKVMTSRLNSYGYEVVHAENGFKAVEMFPEVQADLILMDIEMPVMNGFMAVNKIRAIEATQQWAWTPIIFLTSSDTVENLITAIEAGGDDFMSKFVPETVLQAKMKAMSRIASLRQRLTVAHAKLQTLADHDGHQSGDDCLKSVAKAIQAATHQTNAQGITQQAFAARYGGEEFAVVIPSASQEGYQQLSHAIVSAVFDLGIAHEKNSDWGCTTISVGGNWQHAANGDLKHVFRQADENLYRAKELGRNRAVI